MLKHGALGCCEVGTREKLLCNWLLYVVVEKMVTCHPNAFALVVPVCLIQCSKLTQDPQQTSAHAYTQQKTPAGITISIHSCSKIFVLNKLTSVGFFSGRGRAAG